MVRKLEMVETDLMLLDTAIVKHSPAQKQKQTKSTFYWPDLHLKLHLWLADKPVEGIVWLVKSNQDNFPNAWQLKQKMLLLS